ncbi:hypothetical protein BGX26_001361 [Mortierella sp. AD094]|nr:hypothetical protein BGX26_001361 [Mortierella sp. AD094]
MVLENYGWSMPQCRKYQAQALLPMNPGLQVEDAQFQPASSQNSVVQPQIPIYQESIQRYRHPMQLARDMQHMQIPPSQIQQAQILESNIQIQKPQLRIAQTPAQQQMHEMQKKLPHPHQDVEPSSSLQNPAIRGRVGTSLPSSGTSAKASGIQRNSEEADPVSTASKRKRTAISLRDKSEVLNYADQNPDATKIEIANHFRMHRTTVYGILKKGPGIQELLDRATNRPQASLVLDSYRHSESRFLILEELLVIWLKDLKLQWIQVSNKKIMTQAQEIYRMLFDPLQVPLHPCLFTSGWLKGFQKRKSISSRSARGKFGNESPLTAEDNRFASSRVRRYRECDIYSCETTSMHLNFVAPNFLQEKSQDKATGKSDLFSASIVTCFDATGSDKREPLVLVRQGEPLVFETIGYHEMVHNAGVEDLKKLTLIRWLMEFDRTLTRPILLFVDETIWRLLKSDCKDSESYLKLIDVIKVPERHAGSSPMGAGIAKEFKSSYYLHLIGALNRRAERLGGNEKDNGKLDTLEEHLHLIQTAWDTVDSRNIKHLFQKFLEPIGPTADSLASELQAIQPSYYSAMLSGQIKYSFPEMSDAVIQYFANLDKDTGPSSFMRSKIQQISHHPDFFRYFKHGGVDIVRVARLYPKSKPEPYVQAACLDSPVSLSQIRADRDDSVATTGVPINIDPYSYTLSTRAVPSITTTTVATATTNTAQSDIIPCFNSIPPITAPPIAIASIKSTYTVSVVNAASTANAISRGLASTPKFSTKSPVGTLLYVNSISSSTIVSITPSAAAPFTGSGA